MRRIFLGGVGHRRLVGRLRDVGRFGCDDGRRGNPGGRRVLQLDREDPNRARAPQLEGLVGAHQRADGRAQPAAVALERTDRHGIAVAGVVDALAVEGQRRPLAGEAAGGAVGGREAHDAAFDAVEAGQLEAGAVGAPRRRAEAPRDGRVAQDHGFAEEPARAGGRHLAGPRQAQAVEGQRRPTAGVAADLAARERHQRGRVAGAVTAEQRGAGGCPQGHHQHGDRTCVEPGHDVPPPGARARGRTWSHATRKVRHGP